MSFIKEHIHGIIGAAVFAAIMIAILLLFGFTVPYPLPEERGILIDFGGGGSLNAGASSSTTSNNQNVSTQTPSSSGVLTSDNEDTPSYQSSQTPNLNENTTNTNTENPDPTTQSNVTSNIPQPNSRVSGLAGLGGIGTGTAGTGTGSGNPGTGTGGQGTGRSGPGGGSVGVLSGAPIYKVDPPRRPNVFGKVELEITVDTKGNVIEVEVKYTNCNECNQDAKDAVRKWKYAADKTYEYRKGTVTIDFKPE